MQLALEQAMLAEQAGEVPVGAVVVDASGKLIGTGYNLTISQHDASAHAEVMALRAAGRHMGNYRLPGATLYVTLEPCAMCMGAMLHARLARLVFGAYDPKTGACGSVINLSTEARLNHQTVVEGGVMAESCGDILRHFFRRKRQRDLDDE